MRTRPGAEAERGFAEWVRIQGRRRRNGRGQRRATYGRFLAAPAAKLQPRLRVGEMGDDRTSVARKGNEPWTTAISVPIEERVAHELGAALSKAENE